MYAPLKASNDIVEVTSALIPFRRLGDTPSIVSSQKKNGLRCLIICGDPVSSSMKSVENGYTLEMLKPLLEYSREHNLVVDMELWDPTAGWLGQQVGAITAYNSPIGAMGAYVFDAAPFEHWENQCIDLSYRQRIDIYYEAVHRINHPRIIALSQRPVRTAEDALELFEMDVRAGEEGSMLRALDIWHVGGKPRGGWYKHGRATNKQAIIFKLKHTNTLDGWIVEVHQRRKMREDFERTTNILGRLEQPKTQDAFELDDCIGSLTVEYTCPTTGGTVRTGVTFGPGFDMPARRELWHLRYVLLGKHVEFTYYANKLAPGGAVHAGRLTRFRPDKD
jgi:hypothetical protein